jgi:alpha-beta hydrolase superfamily lysophospholipase
MSEETSGRGGRERRLAVSSPSSPVSIHTAAEYVGDVSAVVNLAKSRHPGVPVYHLGHSAGVRRSPVITARLPGA